MKHPHEADLIKFIGHIKTEEYCKKFAAWIKNDYPGSAEKLLPVLREQWKKLG